MRQTWDGYWLDIAHAAASRGTCPRLKVGAVIVRDNRIISTGYNGSPPGEAHCEEVGCLLVDGRCKRALHAEENAIKHSYWWQRSGATMYCTHAPCSACAEKVIKSGVIEVIYQSMYKNSMPDLQPYHQAGIVVRHLGE